MSLETQTHWSKDKIYGKRGDWLAVLVLVCFGLLFFAKTIFGGLAVSKIWRLAEWDTLFSPLRTGITSAMDPSLPQMVIPNYFLVGQLWHSGNIPLWNPYSGFGMPLLADIQSRAFSPFRLPFYCNPTMQTYNLELVWAIIIGSVATYGLARALGLARLMSLFAAVTYGFCPYVLFYSELMGGGYAFLPLVFLGILYASESFSFAKIFAAGVACFVLLTTAHPEISFFGILLASLLSGSIILTDKSKLSNPANSKLFRIAITFGGIALVAFSLAAPQLLPFFEYLAHADCYKFSSAASSGIPLLAVIYNLLQPGFGGASPFLGIVVAMLLPFAVITTKGKTKCLLLVAILALSIVCQIFPINLLVAHRPFSCLMTIYCFPVFLLLATLLASFALQEILSQKHLTSYISLGAFVLGIFTVIFIPAFLLNMGISLRSANFDSALPSMTVNLPHWRLDLLLLFLVTSILFINKKIPAYLNWLPAILTIIISFISQGSIARAALPCQPHFDFPVYEPLPFLQKAGGRVLSTGNHLMRPNVNVVYGIKQIQCLNPLLPADFRNFIQETGASVDQFNQIFQQDLSSRFLNISGVKYVSSLSAVVCSGDILPPPQSIRLSPASSTLVKDQLSLSKIKFAYDLANSEIIGTLQWQAKGPALKRYTYCLVLLDARNQVIWFSDQQTPKIAPEKFGIPIPLGIAGNEVFLGVQIFDRQTQQFLTPAAHPKHVTGSVLVVAAVKTDPSTQTKETQRHLQLKLETSNKIRIYENTHALPEAYIVHKAQLATSHEDVPALLKNPAFNPSETVILEKPQTANLTSTGIKRLAKNILSDKAGDLVTAQRLTPNTVNVSLLSRTPGFLVLADTYYPGWQATLDGKEIAILRANYLFRAIAIPEGRHRVQFQFKPQAFLIGIYLFFIAATAAILLVLRRLLQHVFT